MPAPIQLAKADVRRAMVRHHFAPCPNLGEAFRRLRSVQFDPIAPIGCNHDLVLQSRVEGYRVGEWEEVAYRNRQVYDGWDKCACLIPLEGWPVRRIFHTLHRKWFEKRIFEDHRDAVEAVLNEIEVRGPLQPKDFDFQQRRDEWKGTWFGPSVTKQTLRALWHSGLVMTAGRKSGQHLYDLTERVVPDPLYRQPRVSDEEARREIALDRHRAMGILRPTAPVEIWSTDLLGYAKDRKAALEALTESGEIVPVEVEGLRANATREFLAQLDMAPLEPRVRFVAPLDPFMWDRKMIAHAFSFDYIWEIYVPEAKRRWGYYVLPVLYADRLVARAEFWCRDGVLELRTFRFEDGADREWFGEPFDAAVRQLMRYASATRTVARLEVDATVRKRFQSIRPA